MSIIEKKLLMGSCSAVGGGPAKPLKCEVEGSIVQNMGV